MLVVTQLTEPLAVDRCWNRVGCLSQWLHRVNSTSYTLFISSMWDLSQDYPNILNHPSVPTSFLSIRILPFIMQLNLYMPVICSFICICIFCFSSLFEGWWHWKRSDFWLTILRIPCISRGFTLLLSGGHFTILLIERYVFLKE